MNATLDPGALSRRIGRTGYDVVNIRPDADGALLVTLVPSARTAVPDLVLDGERSLVVVDGVPIVLSPTEFALAAMLLEVRGRVVSRAALLRRVWGSNDAATSNCLNVHMHALRRKVRSKDSQDIILTVRGRGFYVA